MTRIDQFLRQKFGMRWEVMVYRLPSPLPVGITVERAKKGVCDDWEWRLTADNDDAYHTLIAVLRGARQIFSASIVDRPGFLARLVNRPSGVVMDAAWVGVTVGAAWVGLYFLPLP